MKTLAKILLLGLALAYPVPAQSLLRTVEWPSSGWGSREIPVAVESMDGLMVLRVTHTNDTPVQLNLLNIESPPVTSEYYAVTGKVRYAGVKGGGFLEMWSHFPPEQPGSPETSYFSRTMGVSGRMGKITGTSGWRGFELPFNRTGKSVSPSRLEINLHLPGPGTVWLGPLSLVEYSRGPGASHAMPGNAWWGPQQAGQLGIFLGILGGGFGAIAGILVSRGRGRHFVLTAMFVFGVAGGLMLLAGMVALTYRQPVWVWIPLAAAGGLFLALCIPQRRMIRHRYDEMELRRISAADTLARSR